MIKIWTILDRYPQWAAALCLSGDIRKVLYFINSVGDDKNKLKILLLETLHKGLNEIDVNRMSNSNQMAIGEYASVSVPEENLEVSNAACMVIEKLLKAQHLELSQAIYALNQQHKSNTTVYLRFISVFVRASAQSEELFENCNALGVVAELVQLCQSNDVLLQINALELLRDVASTQGGLDYLCSHGVVQWLINTAVGHGGAAADPLISSEAMRTLGEVFRHASQRSFDFVGKVESGAVHHFLDTLVRFLEGSSEADRIAGDSSRRL